MDQSLSDLENPFYNLDSQVHESFLLTLKPKDLQNACRSNYMYSEICADDRFWIRKLKFDFQTDKPLKDYLSYKESWIAYYNEVNLSLDFKIVLSDNPIMMKHLGHTEVDDSFEVTIDKLITSDDLVENVVNDIITKSLEKYPFAIYDFDYEIVDENPDLSTWDVNLNLQVFLSYKTIISEKDKYEDGLLEILRTYQSYPMEFVAGIDYEQNDILNGDSYEFPEGSFYIEPIEDEDEAENELVGQEVDEYFNRDIDDYSNFE